jgi:hypothetical protein
MDTHELEIRPKKNKAKMNLPMQEEALQPCTKGALWQIIFQHISMCQ